VSFDLYVASVHQPVQALVDEALQLHPEPLVVDGVLERDGIEVSTEVGEPRLLAEPPQPMPLDEVRELLAAAASPAARRLIGSSDIWWLPIQVPAAGGEPGVLLALVLASYLAERTGGVVYNPQDGVPDA
jgi:hypothetical protein